MGKVNISNLLFSSDNIQSHDAIVDYLENAFQNDDSGLDNYPEEAVEFAVLALEALADGGEVDFENGIIFDNTWDNYKCHRQVVHSAIGVCSPLTELVQSIFENNDFVSLTFSESTTVPSDDNAITNGFGEYLTPSSYNVEIIFRESFLENATDLSIACATIHESLHAIFVYMYEEGLLLSEDGSPLVEYEDYVLAYINYLHENNNTNGDPAHEVLAEFVEDMATSLSAYGQNTGYDFPFSFYYNLSWAGLTHTDLFDEIHPVFEEGTNTLNLERIEILKTILAEQDNQTQTYQANGNTYQTLPKGNSPNENQPCN